MRKSEKMVMKILKSVLDLVLPVVAVCLLCVLASPDAMCADDDEFLISLPTKKNEAKDKTAAAASQKKENARGTVAEDMLQGVFYDFKQTRNRQPNKDFSAVSSDGEYTGANLDPTLKIVQSFVNGSWQKKYDTNGYVNYSALNAYYCPTTRVWNSSFYIGNTASNTAPRAFGCLDDVKPNCWICIYSGYVVAPFSGKFRFIGFGDDFLVVRVNQNIVFDYGRISATLGTPLNPEKRSALSASSEENPPPRNSIGRPMPSINKGESAANIRGGASFYSKNKLVIRSPEYMDTTSSFGCGLANGSIISVRQGEVIPIEILIGDVGGNFNYVLFVERLDINGKALNPGKPLLLFRTSNDLPPSFTDSSAVAYDKNSPIWKVVDSRGRSIPSHIPPVTKKDDSPGASTEVKSSSGTSSSSPEKQTSTQPKRDPNLVKTVSTSTRGNVTTQTITEYHGDTTIETVTTTEVNGDTTVETKTITEKKNGTVVKTTTSTTTTTSTSASRTDEKPADNKAGEEKKESPKQGSTLVNPFGVVDRPEED